MPFILVSLSQEHTRLCPVLSPLSVFTFPKCHLCSLHTKFSPHPTTQAASSVRFSPAPQCHWFSSPLWIYSSALIVCTHDNHSITLSPFLFIIISSLATLGPIAFSINWKDETRCPLKFLPLLKILIGVIVFSSWILDFLRQILTYMCYEDRYRNFF